MPEEPKGTLARVHALDDYNRVHYFRKMELPDRRAWSENNRESIPYGWSGG
ncbi:MAG: hypothetical protein HQ552_11620 [Desulfobacteraceae bacterium]|nr:hypothetical protein [Desulfobacteraceae bacterium]